MPATAAEIRGWNQYLRSAHIQLVPKPYAWLYVVEGRKLIGLPPKSVYGIVLALYLSLGIVYAKPSETAAIELLDLLCEEHGIDKSRAGRSWLVGELERLG